MFIKKLLYLLCITTSFSVLSEIRFPEIPSKNKPFSISLQTEFFRTQSNYTNFGQYIALNESDFFQYVSFHPSLSYSLSKHYISFSLFAESFFAGSKKEDFEYRVPFKLSIVGLGFNFYHKVKTLFIGLELRGAFPLYTNFQSPTEIIVGDGAYFVEPGLWLIFRPSKTFYIYNRNTFRLRTGGLSSLLFSSLGGVIQTEFIETGLSLDSFFSLLIYDQFSSQPNNRLEILKTANAGSFKFYSVNPSVLSGTAWTTFKFKPYSISFYANLDSIGQNYAKGFTLGLMTKFKWGQRSSFIKEKRKKNMYLNFEEPTKKTIRKKPVKEMYFEEEDDPAIFIEDKKKIKKINQELKDELNLLTEE
ncbi:MAG: hypothetical protein OXC37_04160 [Bdellovibrionaceae bacterium]|nr:hypothetical protein [Pseudobdellovibrionaceae bacterium]